MTRPERTETAKLQELIVNVLEQYPEGLSTDELINEMGTLIPMNEDELIEVVKGAIRK